MVERVVERLGGNRPLGRRDARPPAGAPSAARGAPTGGRRPRWSRAIRGLLWVVSTCPSAASSTCRRGPDHSSPGAQRGDGGGNRVGSQWGDHPLRRGRRRGRRLVRQDPGLDRSATSSSTATRWARDRTERRDVLRLDPSAKSSTLACDSHYTFQDACMPVLYPGDQQDVPISASLPFGCPAIRAHGSGSRSSLRSPTASDRRSPTSIDTTRAIPSGSGRRAAAASAPVHGRAPPGTRTKRRWSRRTADCRQAYVRHNGLDRSSGPGAVRPVSCVRARPTSTWCRPFPTLGSDVWPTSACAS